MKGDYISRCNEQRNIYHEIFFLPDRFVAIKIRDNDVMEGFRFYSHERFVDRIRCWIERDGNTLESRIRHLTSKKCKVIAVSFDDYSPQSHDLSDEADKILDYVMGNVYGNGDSLSLCV